MLRLRGEAVALLDGLNDAAVAQALQLYIDYVVNRDV
jgi:hypothetical protein